MVEPYNRLKSLLCELFQFDREDLDFGIYRIINHKREEILKFLDEDLLPQVREAFGEYKAGEADQIREQMAEIQQAAAKFNADPEENEEGLPGTEDPARRDEGPRGAGERSLL